MKFLIIALACFTAQALAAPSKALEDDVAAARQASVDLTVEAQMFANRLDLFVENIDVKIRPLANTIVGQLDNLNVSSAGIESQFTLSFTLVQDGIRSVEATLRTTTQTLDRIVEDLDSSNWNNLRNQDIKLREEMALIDTQYAQAKTDITTSNTQLETDLIAALEGQDSIDMAEVLSNWQNIKDIYNSEVADVDNIKIVYDGRGTMTLNAIDVVLDQV